MRITRLDLIEVSVDAIEAHVGDEFGKRCVRPARSARQRGREPRHGRAAVPVQRPQINVASG
jgi:hypothetical protein